MRIAIVSDIHANLQAWRAVRDDFLRRDVDTVVCLGDIVGYGPNPAEVLADVRETCANIIMGNHDAAAAGLLDTEILSDAARRSAAWTARNLDPAARDSLAALPLTLESDDLLFAHADSAAPEQWGYVETPELARASLAAVTARIVFLGHTHFPEIYTRSPDGNVTQTRPAPLQMQDGFRYLINVGSVGDPRDGGERASYVIHDTDAGRIEFHSIAFDVPAFARAIAAIPELATPWFLQNRGGRTASGEREHAVKIIRAARGQIGRAPIRLTTAQLRAATTARLQTGKKAALPATPRKNDRPKKQRTWPVITIAAFLIAAACTAIYLTSKSGPSASPASSVTRQTSPQAAQTFAPAVPATPPPPIHLMASAAKVTGDLCLQVNNGITNLGCWQRANFFPAWTLTLTNRTTYEVTLRYTTPNKKATYAVETGTAKLQGTAPITGDWFTYKTHAPGRITLEPGTTHLSLKPVNMHGPLMNIERITLKPVP